jgi:hypothetical protein
VSASVGAVAKRDRNDQQHFRFRGIDAVMNACSPALREHGVTVLPLLVSINYEVVETGTKRTPMGFARVVVDYVFHGPAGDSLTARVPGEAMDSGDKAVPKAMSVAFRTALLQTLTLPTDEPEPDAYSYERSDATALTPAQEATVNEAADAIRGCDDDDHLRHLWRQVADSGLPEHAASGLRALINERKRQLDDELLESRRPERLDTTIGLDDGFTTPALDATRDRLGVPPRTGERAASSKQVGMILGLLDEARAHEQLHPDLDMTPRVAAIVGRLVTRVDELSAREASAVIKALQAKAGTR